MKHKSRWDLPKGHVDPGETDLECAFRELEEETGIPSDAVELDPVFCFEHKYEVNARRYGPKPVQKTLLVFLGTLEQDIEIVVTEHDSFEWFDWDPPHDIQKKTINPLLEEFAEHLQQVDGIF